MVCDLHNAPAAFFSHKEDRYVCFKCLVHSEQLLYIDKSYKEKMEEFDSIKNLTIEAIKSNAKNTTIISSWHREIRSALMRMRTKYVTLIDKFIYDFGKAFNNSNQKGNKHTFSNEDKNLSVQVEELKNK